MFDTKKVALWAVAISLLTASTAMANTISVFNANNSGIVSDTGIDVVCSPDCEGFLLDGSLSSVRADGFIGQPASEGAVELQFAALLDVGVDLVTATKTGDTIKDANGNEIKPSLSFNVTSEYFWIKQSTWRAYFKTSGTTSVRVIDDVSNYGEIDVVPLPAAGWLLIAGLGGLVAYGRKKRWA